MSRVLVPDGDTVDAPAEPSQPCGSSELEAQAQATAEARPETSTLDHSRTLSDEVEKASSELFGNALRDELMRLGMLYGKQGTDSTKQFILALPPGSISRPALEEALRQLPIEVIPEMIAWLDDKAEEIGKGWSREGMSALVDKWTNHDPRATIKYLADQSGLDPAARRSQVEYALQRAPQGSDIVAMVDSIVDEELQNKLTHGKAYMREKLGSQPNDVISYIVSGDDEELRNQGLTSLAQLLIDGNVEPRQALTSLLNSDFPEKHSYISSRAFDWLRRDVNAALEWIGNLEDQTLRSSIIRKSWKTIAAADAEAAEMWMNSMTESDKEELPRDQ